MTRFKVSFMSQNFSRSVHMRRFSFCYLLNTWPNLIYTVSIRLRAIRTFCKYQLTCRPDRGTNILPRLAYPSVYYSCPRNWRLSFVSNPSNITPHYGNEGFKWVSKFFPHYAESRKSFSDSRDDFFSNLAANLHVKEKTVNRLISTHVFILHT